MPTTTLDFDHPVKSVWACLVDPLAVMWLTPKAAFLSVPPEPIEGFAELRCVWQDRWRKGIRSSVVWEVETVPEARRVTFRELSDPGAEHTVEFALSGEGATCTAEIVEHQDASWRGRLDPLRSDQTSVVRLGQRLLEAVSGNVPAPIDPQIMTWAPGAGANEQSNQTAILAPSKIIWSLVDPASTAHLPATEQLASWRTKTAGVEYRHDVSRLADGAIAFEFSKVTHSGKFQLTTVNTRGTQVDYQLLPDAQAWLLRTTHRWTIPLRAGKVRTEARAWLARVKVTAETLAGPPPEQDPEQTEA